MLQKIVAFFAISDDFALYTILPHLSEWRMKRNLLNIRVIEEEKRGLKTESSRKRKAAAFCFSVLLAIGVVFSGFAAWGGSAALLLIRHMRHPMMQRTCRYLRMVLRLRATS